MPPLAIEPLQVQALSARLVLSVWMSSPQFFAQLGLLSQVLLSAGAGLAHIGSAVPASALLPPEPVAPPEAVRPPWPVAPPLAVAPPLPVAPPVPDDEVELAAPRTQ